LEIPTVAGAMCHRFNGPAPQPRNAAKDAPKGISEAAFEGRSARRLNVHGRSTVHDIVNIALSMNIVNNRPAISALCLVVDAAIWPTCPGCLDTRRNADCPHRPGHPSHRTRNVRIAEE